MLTKTLIFRPAMHENPASGKQTPEAHAVMGERPRLRCVSDSTGAVGFTLVELMVVNAIIGILGAIAIPNYIAYVQRARMTKALSDLRTMDRLIQYHIAVSHREYGCTADQPGRNW